MHVSNLPLVATSITFLVPLYASIETDNFITAVCWAALTCTSTLVHLTKQPYHLYGPGNCIPAFHTLDVAVTYACVLRALVDGWNAGSIGFLLSSMIVLYTGVLFLVGKQWNTFVYASSPTFATLSHVSVHLLSSIGGTGVIYLRAFKNGLSSSQI